MDKEMIYSGKTLLLIKYWNFSKTFFDPRNWSSKLASVNFSSILPFKQLNDFKRMNYECSKH